MTDPTYDELLDIVDAQRKLIESLGRKNQWLMEQMPIRRADLLAALGAERVAKYRPGYELWLVPVEADDE